jgi:NADH:ubiquinone oxidoreductase subunit 3 (subunit A)
MLTSNPSYVAAYYTVFLLTCVIVIVVLQFVLRRAGSLVLHDAYHSNPTFARAICRLLDIGYYLVCVGYVVMTVHTDELLGTAGQLLEAVTVKLGFFLLLLGALHVFNLLLLALFRRRTNPAPAVS